MCLDCMVYLWYHCSKFPLPRLVWQCLSLMIVRQFDRIFFASMRRNSAGLQDSFIDGWLVFLSLHPSYVFLSWLGSFSQICLVLLLNITISMHVNTQLKAGNHMIWSQMPFPNTIVTQTTSIPLEVELQAPALLEPPAIVQPVHPQSANVNPATVVDGRDEISMRRTSVMVDHRLGDGRDNV